VIDLRLGDCVDVMRTLSGESVDLILTSPPYDKLRAYASGSTFDFEGVAGQCKRLLKPGGVLVWVVGDQTKDGDESGTSFRQALHFKSIGLRLRDTMIWRKITPSTGGDHKSHYRGAFEYMFVFTVGPPNTINLLHEPCMGKVRVRTVKFRDHDKFLPSRKLLTKPTKVRPNIWDYMTDHSGTGHPAVFPLQLAIDHVLSWTNPGDLVLDPFVGSGTTLEACIKTDRNGIGIELSPTYHAIAERRIAAAREEAACLLF
jgi:DNA modification methylase